MVVFFLEWLEQDVIRSASDIERAIGVTVLGSVPPGLFLGEDVRSRGERRRLVAARRDT